MLKAYLREYPKAVEVFKANVTNAYRRDRLGAEIEKALDSLLPKIVTLNSSSCFRRAYNRKEVALGVSKMLGMLGYDSVLESEDTVSQTVIQHSQPHQYTIAVRLPHDQGVTAQTCSSAQEQELSDEEMMDKILADILLQCSGLDRV